MSTARRFDGLPKAQDGLLLREFWNAVAEWERKNQRNNKYPPAELSRAYERAQTASDAVAARIDDLERDTARLDWFDAVRPRVGLGEEGETRLLSRSGDGALLASELTIRAAIDAAMRRADNAELTNAIGEWDAAQSAVNCAVDVEVLNAAVERWQEAERVLRRLARGAREESISTP